MVEDTVTRDDLNSSITAFKDQTTLVRQLNTKRLETKARGQYKLATVRINAVEASLKEFEANLNRVPTSLDREAKRLNDLFDEKLKQVSLRMDSFNGYEDAMRANAKEAINAAFSAAKELTTVYNTNTANEINAIKALISGMSDIFTTKLEGLADRMNRNDGLFAGGKGVVGAAISLITVIVLVTGLFLSLHNNGPGADTKRVDDLISVITEQNRQIGQRMDALSARINTLTPPRAP